MDIEDLLKSLNARKARFVIIGATAFPVHGYARATLDIDLFIEPTLENAERVLVGLRQFGYDLSDITLEELLTKKLLIRQYLVETDIHPFVAGRSFDEVWQNRLAGHYGRVDVFYAGLDDLIAMKSAAGRAKDQEDLKVLRMLKERRK